MAINVQPKVQRHHCPTVRSRSHAHACLARARTHTHTADNGFLDSVAVRCRDARRGEKGRAAEAAVKTSFALCSVRGKKKKSGGDTKMVMTVKAFSHTLAGGSGKRRARRRDRE